MNAVNAISAVSPVIDIEYQKRSFYHDQKSSKLAADRGVKWTAMDRQSCRNYRSIQIWKSWSTLLHTKLECLKNHPRGRHKHHLRNSDSAADRWLWSLSRHRWLQDLLSVKVFGVYVFLALFSIVTGAISGFPLLPFLVGRCRKHLLSSIYWLIFDGLCVSPSTIFIHLLISSTFVFRVHTFSGGECKKEVKE